MCWEPVGTFFGFGKCIFGLLCWLEGLRLRLLTFTVRYYFLTGFRHRERWRDDEFEHDFAGMLFPVFRLLR